MSTEIVYSDATRLAELIRTKEVSPVEVVQAYLNRIEAVDPKVNAIVTVANGACRTKEGNLAGSTLTLDRALRNIVALGVPLPAAVRMLTRNPATVLGLEFKKGALRKGADADIVLLDESLHVRQVWTQGIPLQPA